MARFTQGDEDLPQRPFPCGPGSYRAVVGTCGLGRAWQSSYNLTEGTANNEHSDCSEKNPLGRVGNKCFAETEAGLGTKQASRSQLPHQERSERRQQWVSHVDRKGQKPLVGKRGK